MHKRHSLPSVERMYVTVANNDRVAPLRPRARRSRQPQPFNAAIPALWRLFHSLSRGATLSSFAALSYNTLCPACWSVRSQPLFAHPFLVAALSFLTHPYPHTYIHRLVNIHTSTDTWSSSRHITLSVFFTPLACPHATTASRNLLAVHNVQNDRCPWLW